MIRLTPLQMFGISALLLAFDFLMLVAFVAQAPVNTAGRENWDFRIAELRKVDTVEPTSAVAGASVERDTPESEPRLNRGEPRIVEVEPAAAPTPDTLTRSEVKELINFGFGHYLNESEKPLPIPYWPVH